MQIGETIIATYDSLAGHYRTGDTAIFQGIGENGGIVISVNGKTLTALPENFGLVYVKENGYIVDVEYKDTFIYKGE